MDRIEPEIDAGIAEKPAWNCYFKHAYDDYNGYVNTKEEATALISAYELATTTSFKSIRDTGNFGGNG